MRVGLIIFPTDKGIQPVELGREAEARGFDSLWFPEHSHIPVSRRTPWGGREGAPPLPEEYWRTHDQFVALAAIAATTETLKLGTGITLVAQRDPLWLAKEIASLDMISNGRVLFGVGFGWNHEEMENHGATYETRFAIMREHVLAMKEIWTKEEASFHGKYVNFDPIWSWPKPMRKAGPPIILGGETDHTLKRVVEYCDGWFPRPRQGFSGALAVERLKKMADSKGRDVKSLTITVFGAPNDAAVLEEYAKAGIQYALLAVPDLSRDEILKYLDKIAPLAKAHP